MPFIKLDTLEEKEMVPGFRARFHHTASMTMSYWTIDEGSALPEHAHPHEQVSNVIEGRFEMTLEGETRVLDAGTLASIPPNAVHSGRALTNCKILDVFYPIREDYR